MHNQRIIAETVVLSVRVCVCMCVHVCACVCKCKHEGEQMDEFVKRARAKDVSA